MFFVKFCGSFSTFGHLRIFECLPPVLFTFISMPTFNILHYSTLVSRASPCPSSRASDSDPADVEAMDDDTLLSGPISISIDLALYPPDSEELYRKELSILRYLSWLVKYFHFPFFFLLLLTGLRVRS